MTFAIRRATEADIDAVLALWATARTEYATTEDRGDDVRALSERSALFVALSRDGVVIGAVIAGWDGWRGMMYRLAVADEWRRQGVGLALVGAAEGWLVRSGARRISVLVAFEDAGARALWSAAGYAADADIGRMVRNV